MQIWWTLPGNRRYLDSLVDALSEGQSVIINLAALAPQGIETALEQLLAERDYRTSRVSLPEEPPALPTSWLYEQLIHDLPVEKARDIHALGSEPTLAGQVILLSVRDGANATAWTQFVSQAQAALRLRSVWERPFFILVARQQPPSRLPPPDSGLLVRHYLPSPQRHELRYLCSGFIAAQSDLDLFQELRLELVIHLGMWDAALCHELRYLCSGFIAAQSDLDLFQELRLELVIHLGMWDAALCQDLSRQPLRELLNPMSLLRSWAEALGWNAGDTVEDRTAETRLSGRSGTFTGGNLAHSAMAALRGDQREINRRLWKAQIAVIFPYIEERRAYWVEKTRHLLRPPFQTGPDSKVNSAEDLEIGQLLYFIRARGQENAFGSLREVIWLKEARHKLAHLEVLDAAFLENSAVAAHGPGGLSM